MYTLNDIILGFDPGSDYLQIEFPKVRRVTGFRTQGRIQQNMFCAEYKVFYWAVDVNDWELIRDSAGNEIVSIIQTEK